MIVHQVNMDQEHEVVETDVALVNGQMKMVHLDVVQETLHLVGLMEKGHFVEFDTQDEVVELYKNQMLLVTAFENL